jgi:hypothetical protein
MAKKGYFGPLLMAFAQAGSSVAFLPRKMHLIGTAAARTGKILDAGEEVLTEQRFAMHVGLAAGENDAGQSRCGSIRADIARDQGAVSS